VWAKARAIALTDTQAASALARHPYDLRHACVSTWLKAGTEPKRVAEWAGHSVEVLLRIYTHCLDQGEHESAAAHPESPGEQHRPARHSKINFGAYLGRAATGTRQQPPSGAAPQD
jgi:hypothetical protein